MDKTMTLSSDSLEELNKKYFVKFTRTVKNITDEIRNYLTQKFPENEVTGDGANVDCSSELKNLIEENKSLSEEVEKKEQEIALSQSKMQRLIEDKKLLKTETKNTYEALLMARKYYKKYLEIYCMIESSTDKGYFIVIQYFTESKKDTDMFTARFFKDMTSGKYEVKEVKPKLKSLNEIKKRLQETGDVPYALATIRLEFLKIKNKEG